MRNLKKSVQKRSMALRQQLLTKSMAVTDLVFLNNKYVISYHTSNCNDVPIIGLM